jgi:hypothetical protein
LFCFDFLSFLRSSRCFRLVSHSRSLYLSWRLFHSFIVIACFFLLLFYFLLSVYLFSFTVKATNSLPNKLAFLQHSPLSSSLDIHLFLSATRAEVQTDVALYIGLAVAFAVFTLVAVFIFRLLRRKGRDHSMYNMAASGKWTGSVVGQH